MRRRVGWNTGLHVAVAHVRRGVCWMEDLITCRGEGRVLSRAAVIQCHRTRYRSVRGLCLNSWCNAAVHTSRGSWHVSVVGDGVVCSREGGTAGVRHYGVVERWPRESGERPAIFLHACNGRRHKDKNGMQMLWKNSSWTAKRRLSHGAAYRRTGVSRACTGVVSKPVRGVEWGRLQTVLSNNGRAAVRDWIASGRGHSKQWRWLCVHNSPGDRL